MANTQYLGTQASALASLRSTFEGKFVTSDAFGALKKEHAALAARAEAAERLSAPADAPARAADSSDDEVEDDD